MPLGRLWKPETFQGRKKKKDYFEGWYFKLIDKPAKTVLAAIPGIAIGENGEDAHSFIQIIDAVTGYTEYFRFGFDEFKAEKGRFNVRIADNCFSDKSMKINLENENFRISGDLEFKNIRKLPKSIINPGIMGPFSFIPTMECYHGIVNISHTIDGVLDINGVPTDISGGEGYIEKDWGRSFPSSWIWMQGNHFENFRASFMFSLARIPWMGKSFTGLISFLYTDTKFYRFATYNGGKILESEIDGNNLYVKMKNMSYILEFRAKYSKGGILKAPKNGMMTRLIEESITAEVKVKLSDRKGNVLFDEKSDRVGMEISGTLDEILK